MEFLERLSCLKISKYNYRLDHVVFLFFTARDVWIMTKWLKWTDNDKLSI
jgi:hypothetical protein